MIADEFACESDPCKHDALCFRVDGGYACVCTMNYTGPMCEQRTSTAVSICPCVGVHVHSRVAVYV